jgi:predicted DNA-binding transcriptional regulator AlpA
MRKSAVAVGKHIVQYDALTLDPLLTVAEVAELLRCSVSSLNKWRLSGDGPKFVYVGRRVRYRPADVTAYVVTQTRASTSEGALAT